MVVSLYRYRHYILRNALSDVRHKYVGTGLGVFWNVVTPLVHIAVYAIVFSEVMRHRVPGWVLYLSSGILTWGAFNECVTRGLNSFRENAAYLKKLPIPEQVFVARSAASATMSLGITLSLLMLLAVFYQKGFSPLWLLVPVVCVVWQVMGFGLGLMLGTLNVFVRDVGPITGMVFQVWFWASPIIYPIEILPEWMQPVIKFNPAYPFLHAIHELLVNSTMPPAWVWPAMAGWAVGAMVAGFLVLRGLRGEIRDML